MKSIFGSSVVISLLVARSFCCEGQIISTVAGNGTSGYSGDGILARRAELRSPACVTTDSAGNLYIADVGNNRIRKVNAAGIITTVAGTGSYGVSVDGTPATSAEIAQPLGLAIDHAGKLYFVDADNYLIRRINSSGLLETIAGTGASGHTGDGGPATAAEIDLPTYIAFDSAGNLYFSDGESRTNCVRKISTTGIITNFAGNGMGGFAGDGGPATLAHFFDPTGIAIDRAGNVYIGDQGNNRVRKVDTAGIITTIAGTGTAGFSGDSGQATAAELSGPGGLFIDKHGNIYIANYNNRIRKISPAGIITTIAGNGVAGYSGDGCNPDSAVLNHPNDVTVNDSGDVSIADRANNRVREIINDHAPFFTAGHSLHLSVCGGPAGDSINTLLTVTDVDTGQTETWSAVTAPVHGVATAYCSAADIGGIVSPAGLYYTPAMGYTGYDTFKVVVIDGGGMTDTATVYVTVNDCALASPGLSTGGAGIAHVFPNPNVGAFTINVQSGINEEARVVITNMVGQVVKEITGLTNENIDVRLIAHAGVYFISVVTREGIVNEKVVVR
jgi:sugar lactone lactonase YvrE